MTTECDTRPAYIRIQDDLRARIQRSEWQPGEQIPTERELERQFNMSRITISKALTNLVSEGYLMRRQGRGTFVTEKGGQDPTAGCNMVARLVKFIAPIGYHGVIHIKYGGLEGMHDALADSHFEVGVDFYRTSQEEAAFLRRDTDAYYAGFLNFFRPDDESVAELRRLKDKGFPFVLLDAYPPDMDVDFVVTDNIDGGMQVVKHLTSLGHRRIAYITRPISRSSLTDRLSGFVKGMILADVPVSNENVVRLTDSLEGAVGQAVSAVDKLLSGPQPPTAIFFGNDDLALEVLEFLVAKGVKVPEDLSIVGYDNIDRTASACVPLTTVAQDFYTMGKVAAEILIRRLKDDPNQQPERVFLKPRLVVRSSTQAPSI